MENTLEAFKIKSITNLKKLNKNITLFRWVVFLNCNYNCSYCFQKDIKKDLKKINIDNCLKTAKKINFLLKENNIKDISICGGEITLLSAVELKNIIENFENNINIEIITNFFRKADYFLPLIEERKERLLLTVSYHDEFTTLEEYFKNVELFLNISKSKKSKIQLEFTLNDNTFKYLLQFYSNFLKLQKNFKDRILLKIFEEVKIKENLTVGSSFNYLKIIKRYPFLKKYFDNEKTFQFLFEDGTKNTTTLPNITGSTVLNVDGVKCTCNTFLLNHNDELEAMCHNIILSKNFSKLNDEDLKKIKIPKNYTCNNMECTKCFALITK